jgi:hypothetical protein
MKAIKCNNMVNLKSTKGSLTVEAAVVLPIFICAIFTIAFIIKIIYVHEIIQHSITESAVELSSYSYLYSIAGFKELNDTLENTMQQKEQQAKQSISTVVDAYQSYNVFSKKIAKPSDNIDSSSIYETEESMNNLMENMNQIMAMFKEIQSDPESYGKSVIALGGRSVYDTVKASLLGTMVKANMGKYLKTENITDANIRLKNLGVTDGISGLNFDKSSLFVASDGVDGSASIEDIDIIVSYKFNFQLPIPIIKEVEVIQRATVRGWMNGDK